MRASLATLLAVLAAGALAQSPAPPVLVDPLRGSVPIADEATPPPLGNQENKDVRRVRAFAWQPPTIPHRIDGYQVDRNANRCMMCHARDRIEESRAIPLSPTHYMNRDGTMRGDVSPRRYFCTTCHVPQEDVKPLVGNRFETFETVRATGGPRAAPRDPAPARR
jgi:cytochrome c-type protein NapB